MIEDQEARTRAIDPTRSFIVQAPAGSGKTELLTQRFLGLLARVDKPEEIIAITFTRKAAGEMRERLLKALSKAREADQPAEPHHALTWRLGRAVLERDARMGWKLEANPSRLRIQTIDALCSSLVRQLPVLSGLGTSIEPTERPEELYQEAALRTLAMLDSAHAVSDTLARVLAHLDNDLGKVQKLIVTMLERRDQWLPYTTSFGPRFREHLEGGLHNLIVEELEQLDAALPYGIWDDWLAVTRYAVHNQEGHFPHRERPNAHPDHLEVWGALAGTLLTKEGGFRRALSKLCGFPAGTTKAEKVECKEWKERAVRVIESFDADEELAERLHAIRSMPAPRYTDDQWTFLKSLFQVLSVAAAQLWLVFGEREEVDFTEISQRALQALGTPDAPTDLALTLDARIQHLLVDEFQDTSLSQRRLLEQLMSGWQSGDGRTLFLVGDPMQSIYRFRNAEVGIFLDARQGRLGEVELEPLTLSVNFRCQEGLVEWFNLVFGDVFPRLEDRVHGGVPYAPSSAVHARRDAMAVQPHAFPPSGGRDEAQRMVDLIRAAREEDPEQTVGVLVRGRSHLVQLLPRLREEGLDFQGVEIEALMGRTVVLDLLALTRALVHPGNRPAWIAVLRAPWCGLSLHDLHTLLDVEEDCTVWQSLHSERIGSLTLEGQQRIARLLPALVHARAVQGRRTLRAWVAETWNALGGPACCERATELEDAENYLDFLEGFDDGGDLRSLETLETSLKNLKAKPDAGASGKLQIMTIHKAKGLEFDVVLLPGLARPTGKDDPRLFRWLERPSQGKSDLLLAPIRSADSEEDATYKLLQRIDDKKSEHENIRLLYVAATRARRHLHLLFELKQDDSESYMDPLERSLLAHLWNHLKLDLRMAENEAAAARGLAVMEGQEVEFTRAVSMPAAAVPLVRLPADFALAPPVVAAEEESVADLRFDCVRENLRKIGTVVHQLLHRIGRDGIESWPLERLEGCAPQLKSALFYQGLGSEELEEATERALRAVVSTARCDRGRWILSNRHTDIHNEYALRSRTLRDGIVDRTFVDAGDQRWVIDYKTSLHEGAGLEEFLELERQRYQPQLQRYVDLLEAQHGEKVRAGLYFPLLQRWVELEAAPVASLV